jgi:hypothetical protein
VGRAVPKDDGTIYEPAKPQPAPPSQPSSDASATVVESAAMASSVTVPQVPKPAAPAVPVAAPAPKSKAGLLIGVAVVFVIFLVAGVGGFLLWSKSKASKTTTHSNTNNAAVVPTALKEISRYWLELGPAKAERKTKVAALVPIASGQKFTFHLIFDEDGYVYIVGPGEDNKPTAFLTAKPLRDAGVITNKVSKGQEISFPKGDTLTLDEKPGTDNFTIIFSKIPLSSPSFLDEPVTFKPLSANQQADFQAFVSKYQETPPVIEHDESNAGAPFVKVKTTSDPSNNPIVFDIRIQHN